MVAFIGAVYIGIIKDQSIDKRQYLHFIVIYNQGAAASVLSSSMQLLQTRRGGQRVSLNLSVSDLLTLFITRMFHKTKKPKPDSHFRFFPTYKFTRDSVFTAVMTEFIKTQFTTKLT